MSTKSSNGMLAGILRRGGAIASIALAATGAVSAKESTPALVATIPPDNPALAALPEETVERYARRLLERRLAEATEPKTSGTAARRSNPGHVGPAQFELIYITGVGDEARAMVRIDKRYSKLVGNGDALAGWHLSDIGADYVDIEKTDEQARIYLFSNAPGGRG